MVTFGNITDIIEMMIIMVIYLYWLGIINRKSDWIIFALKIFCFKNNNKNFQIFDISRRKFIPTKIFWHQQSWLFKMRTLAVRSMSRRIVIVDKFDSLFEWPRSPPICNYWDIFRNFNQGNIKLSRIITIKCHWLSQRCYEKANIWRICRK